jgi:hypothetical protein
MAGASVAVTELPEWAAKGYGDGDGDGDGDGSGSGYGYGSGYGDGDGDGFQLLAEQYKDHPLVKDKSVVIAFWRSDAQGQSANGGHHRMEPARVGLTHEVKGPLRLCSPNALHASLTPQQWEGDRWWVVALHEPVKSDGTKVGSLKRTFLEEWT